MATANPRPECSLCEKELAERKACLLCQKNTIEAFCEECQGYLCPVCCRQHHNIPICKDHTLKTISTTCFMCSLESSDKFCQECKGYLCQECISKHFNIPRCKDHHVTESTSQLKPPGTADSEHYTLNKDEGASIDRQNQVPQDEHQQNSIEQGSEREGESDDHDTPQQVAASVGSSIVQQPTPSSLERQSYNDYQRINYGQCKVELQQHREKHDVPVIDEISVVQETFCSVDLAWEKKIVDRYYISLKDTNPGFSRDWNLTGDMNSLHVDDLSPGEEYVFEIHAMKGQKQGPKSTVSATTKGLPAVENILAIQSTSEYLNLTWSDAYYDADSLEVILDGQEKCLLGIDEKPHKFNLAFPNKSHSLKVTSLKENKKMPQRVMKVDNRGDNSVISMTWKDIEGIDRYEVCLLGETEPWLVKQSAHSITTQIPKEFTITVAAIKDGCKSTPVEITTSTPPKKNKALHSFLKTIGLDKHIVKKMTLQDLLLIDRQAVEGNLPESNEQLPKYVFRKLMMLNYKGRNAQVQGKKSSCHDVPKRDSSTNVWDFLQGGTSDVVETGRGVHPSDVLLAILYCSDIFVQQYFVTKLSKCQIALPFLVHNPADFSLLFPVWAFRFIQKGFCKKGFIGDEGFSDIHMVTAKSKMITFVRFGSLSFSKSELINSILNKKHETFVHRNCKGSKKHRVLVKGTAEFAWYLPSSREGDVFSELVTFINLRGDAKQCEQQIEFLKNISAVFVVILSSAEIKDAAEKIKELEKLDMYVIYIIVDKSLPMQRINKAWKYGIGQTNKATVVEQIQQTLRNILQEATQHPEFSLEDCAGECTKYGILCNEDISISVEARRVVTNIMAEITRITPYSLVKEELLPLQGKEWHEWSEKQKQMNRPILSSSESLSDYQTKLSKDSKRLRELQRTKGFPLQKVMSDIIIGLSETDTMTVNLFLQWLKYELDLLSARELANLQSEYNIIWQREYEQKAMQRKTQSKYLTYTRSMNDIQEGKNRSTTYIQKEKIISSSLGIEHIFREMSQMYECALYTGLTEMDWIMKLPDIAANIMIEGYALELMDGDAGFVPCRWISDVLSRVAGKTTRDKPRVFVLTVLGIQSTGKSTLLNAMFGLQFTVSAGRCTRGAYMQLLKVSEDMCGILDYEFILVIDTEGVKTLELSTNTTQTRDNELATFIIGIADVVLISIFGENLSCINDVLQITVQTFIRMKQVSKKTSCFFIHQNVGALDAKEKLQAGRQRMIGNLDKLTRVAAELEGSNERLFSEVIQFNPDTNIFYLSNLWQGDPPMAPPNPGYCEKIQSLKSLLLWLPSREKLACVQLMDFSRRIENIWNALLRENFLFSFKNTLEVSIFKEENKFNWQLEKYGGDTTTDKPLNAMGNAARSKVYTCTHNQQVVRCETCV